MGIPVWITVVISRFIGGFITGFLAAAVFATSSSPIRPGRLRRNRRSSPTR